jgi:hypothetical protein
MMGEEVVHCLAKGCLAQAIHGLGVFFNRDVQRIPERQNFFRGNEVFEFRRC